MSRSSMSRPLVVVLLLVLLVVWAFSGPLATREPSSAPAASNRIGPYPASQFFMEHDLFLSATDPRTVPAREARHVQPADEVFGVVVGGQARAYPIYMIAYHHVVNDVIQGIPVAITY